MIMAWLGAKALFGLSRGLWVLIAAAAVGVVILWVVAAEKADDRANQELGRTIEREEALTETVERVEQANEAREEISRPGDAGDRLRYDQCLRTARTPENCERFLPRGQAAER